MLTFAGRDAEAAEGGSEDDPKRNAPKDGKDQVDECGRTIHDFLSFCFLEHSFAPEQPMTTTGMV